MSILLSTPPQWRALPRALFKIFAAPLQRAVCTGYKSMIISTMSHFLIRGKPIFYRDVTT